MKNKTVNIPPIIKIILILSILVVVTMISAFIINEQLKTAINLGNTFFIVFIVLFSCILLTKYFDPDLLKSKLALFMLASLIIFSMAILLINYNSSFIIRSYKIGDIQIKLPIGDNHIYGLKDANNKYYYAQYYNDNCLIEIQKTLYNKEYSVLENIKRNIKLEQKITETIKYDDIYNSELTEGKNNIYGIEWNTYYTEVDNIKYTINYLIIDDYIYHINTANYNEKPEVCNNKIDEAFKTIKYNK